MTWASFLSRPVGQLAPAAMSCWRRILLAALIVVGLTVVAPASALAATGQIAGKVTDASTGAGVGDITVYVIDGSENVVGQAVTDYNGEPATTGTYTVPGLATGSYKVEIGSGQYEYTSYAGQYYRNKPTYATADPVAVTDGSTTSGINAALMPTGHEGEITGKVTDASTGQGVGAAGIEVATANGIFFGGEARTNPDGTYTFHLPAGSYRVKLFSNGYVTQFYNDKSSLASADSVNVTYNSTTAGIDAALVPLGGQITGTVTDASTHAGVGNVAVDVYDSGGSIANVATTATDGTYAVATLAAGSYRVGFYPASGAYVSQFYNGQPSLASASPVTVADGTTTSGISAALVQAGGVMISSGNVVSEPQGGSEPATFTITLPAVQSSDTTVDYETIDGTATAAANDYTAVPNGSVTIQPPDTTATVQVQVDSGSGQSTTQTKSFQVQLTSSSGPPINSTGGVADETIRVPGIGGTLTDAAGQEQGGIKITLTGTADTGQAVSQQTTSDGLGRYQFYTDPGTYALTLAPPPGGNGTTDFTPASLACPGGGRPGGCSDIVVGEGDTTIDFRVLTLEIGAVDPASGSPVGGNELMIVGSGFGPAGSGDSVALCALGGACVDYPAVVLRDGLITLKIPEEAQAIAAADGRATVEVQEPADNERFLTSNQVPFNYKLRVDSIDPKRVSPAGGDEAVIKGSGFGPAGTLDEVHFFSTHGDGVEARHVTVLSDDQIKVKIPEEDKAFAHDGGRGTFLVAVPILNDVVISDRTDFRYEVRIDSIAPKSPSATGGKEMAIKGSGFGPKSTADKVVFCAAHARCVSADDVKVLSDDRITAQIPREEKHPAHADGSETVSVVVPIAGKKDVVDSNRVRFKYQS